MVDLDAALGEELFNIAVDRLKRRYQRTATTMTSGGKRKPAKVERGGIDWRDARVVLMVGVLPPRHPTANATAPANLVRLGRGDRIQPHRNDEVEVLVVVA